MSKLKQQHKDHVTIIEFQVGNGIKNQSFKLGEPYFNNKK